MNEPNATEMKVDLRALGGRWRVTIERDGRRQELAGMRELIRYLEALAVEQERPPRGLR